MSATGRKRRDGQSEPRDPFDDYPTPYWCVDRLLEAVPLPAGDWLEPTAGSGSLIKAINARRKDVIWTAVDIQEKNRAPLEALEAAAIVGDFPRMEFDAKPWPPLYKVAISNPPYGIAEDVIRKCTDLALVTVMLLRVNFLASEDRADWMRRWTPDIHVIPNRPSFRLTGTDSTEYAWFVWDQRRVSSKGAVHILASTPKAERMAEKKARLAAARAPAGAPAVLAP